MAFSCQITILCAAINLSISHFMKTISALITFPRFDVTPVYAPLDVNVSGGCCTFYMLIKSILWLAYHFNISSPKPVPHVGIGFSFSLQQNSQEEFVREVSAQIPVG